MKSLRRFRNCVIVHKAATLSGELHCFGLEMEGLVGNYFPKKFHKTRIFEMNRYNAPFEQSEFG